MYITCCSLVAGEQCWPPHAVGTVPDLCQHGVHPPYRGHPQCGQPTDGLSLTKVTGLQCVQYSVHITVYSVYIAVCRVGTYITVYCTRVNHTVQVQRLTERLNITGGGEEAFFGWISF